MESYLEERMEWWLDPKNEIPRPFHDLDAGYRGNGIPSRGGENGGQRGRGGVRQWIESALSVVRELPTYLSSWLTR